MLCKNIDNKKKISTFNKNKSLPVMGDFQHQITNYYEKKITSEEVISDPAGIRTQDPYIKSVLLYQLSYRVGFF